MARVSTVALALGKLITRTRPFSRPAISVRSRSASSSRQMTASAWPIRVSPALVSLGPSLVRSSSCMPTSFSSAATCWLTADCERCSESAAAENEPLAMTSRSTRIRFTSSIRATYQVEKESMLR